MTAMSELKCPFCGDELAMDYTGVMYCCNQNCEKSADWYGSKILWQELICTRKALDVAVDALKLFCGEDVSYYSQSKIDARDARTALEQITALKQKDAK